MIPYIILVIFIIALPMIKIKKRDYCIIIGVIMTILIGFRNIELGMSDTVNVYLPIYNILAKLSFSEAYKYIVSKNYEIGFYMLTKLFIMIINNYRLYLILLATFINIVVTTFIYKNSKIPFLSFLMYFSINYFAMSFTILRHCIALSIILLSYDFIEKRKLKSFIVTVFIASLFHKTALTFLIAYPIANLKVDYKNIFAVTISLCVLTILGKDLLRILINIIDIQKYQIYLNASGDTLTFFFINFLLLIFTMLVLPKEEINNMKQLINIYTIGICIASGTVILGEFYRPSSFFTIFSIILMPNTISLMKMKKLKSGIVYIFSILLIIYFFAFSMINTKLYPYSMQFTI